MTSLEEFKKLNNKIEHKLEEVCRLYGAVESLAKSISEISTDRLQSYTHYALAMAMLKGEDDIMNLNKEIKDLKNSRLDEIIKQFDGFDYPELKKHKPEHASKVQVLSGDLDPFHRDIVDKHLKNLKAELEEHNAGIAINAEILIKG